MKKIILPVLLCVIVIILVTFFQDKDSMKNKELYFSTALDKEYVYTKDGEKTPITITFSQDKVYGFAGVNRYFAGYKVENNNNIIFSPIGSTMMTGSEKDMKMENNYLSLLNNINKIKVYRDRLELITKNNILLKFVENDKSLPLKNTEEKGKKNKNDIIIEDEANLPQI